MQTAALAALGPSPWRLPLAPAVLVAGVIGYVLSSGVVLAYAFSVRTLLRQSRAPLEGWEMDAAIRELTDRAEPPAPVAGGLTVPR